MFANDFVCWWQQRNFGSLSILALSVTLLASWESIARLAKRERKYFVLLVRYIGYMANSGGGFLQYLCTSTSQWRSGSSGMGHVIIDFWHYGTCSLLCGNGLHLPNCRSAVSLDSSVCAAENTELYYLDARCVQRADIYTEV